MAGESEQPEKTRVEIWRSKNDGQVYTRIRAANREVIFPPEGYERKIDARKNIEQLAELLARGFEFVEVEE